MGPRTHTALSELTREPGEERLKAPIDGEHRVPLLHFSPYNTFTHLRVTVQPGTIHVEREGGEAFGIVDYSHDRDNPISVLARTVTCLTVDNHANGWALRLDPDEQIDIKHPDSFELFWRVVAKYMQYKRARLSQQAAS